MRTSMHLCVCVCVSAGRCWNLNGGTILIHGGFTVLGDTENLSKTSDCNVYVHQKKVVQINKTCSCHAVDI